MPIWVLIMGLALLTTALIMGIILFAVTSLRKGGIFGMTTGALAVFGAVSLWVYFKPQALGGLGAKLKGGFVNAE